MFSVGGIWNDPNRITVLLSSFAVPTWIAVFAGEPSRIFRSNSFTSIPFELAARFRPRSAVVALGLRVPMAERGFQFPGLAEPSIRLVLEALALTGVGLLIADLVHKRRLTNEAEGRLRVLVEANPAAIITADENWLIVSANRAAAELIAPGETNLVGIPIAMFFRELPSAWNGKEGPQFSGSRQCHARRRNGESFLADSWVSAYRDEGDPTLAVMVKDAGRRKVFGRLPSPGIQFYRPNRPNARQVDVLRLGTRSREQGNRRA